jgi:hypothetical protein
VRAPAAPLSIVESREADSTEELPSEGQRRVPPETRSATHGSRCDRSPEAPLSFYPPGRPEGSGGWRPPGVALIVPAKRSAHRLFGNIEALSLRLYNPESHQWSLNFSNSSVGTLSQPTVGEFRNGRGEFYDRETISGRAVLVRFVISDITADSCHFEQAFSVDGGTTWEVNWIATDTRSDSAAPR